MNTIQSKRLDLIPMTPAFLEASLAGDQAAAEQCIGLTVPPEWLLHERRIMQLRLDQLRKDPSLQPWLLRAIRLRTQQAMIGMIGFHDRPGAEHLVTLAPGGAEMGYSIFPAYRRQGYASEAVAALMDWAHQQHQVPRFVLSISPQNTASLRIAQHFGFRKVGEQMDEEDGLEEIFLRDVSNGV